MDTFKFRVNGKIFESVNSIIKGKKVLEIAGLEPVEDYELLIKINEKGFEPVQLTEKTDLECAGIEGFKAVPYKELIIIIDDTKIEVEECFMTPNEILAKAEINSDRYYLKEIRKNNVEVSYKDDTEHKVSLTKKSKFISCEKEGIQCVIVNASEKPWSKSEISFEEVVILQYGSIANNTNVIYTINYKRGVTSKPAGSMIRGEVISVNNKMIFNVTQTNKS